MIVRINQENKRTPLFAMTKEFSTMEGLSYKLIRQAYKWITQYFETEKLKECLNWKTYIDLSKLLPE